MSTLRAPESWISISFSSGDEASAFATALTEGIDSLRQDPARALFEFASQRGRFRDLMPLGLAALAVLAAFMMAHMKRLTFCSDDDTVSVVVDAMLRTLSEQTLPLRTIERVEIIGKFRLSTPTPPHLSHLDLISLRFIVVCIRVSPRNIKKLTSHRTFLCKHLIW